MPPQRFSRHSFVSAILDVDGNTLFLTSREPFRFQDFPDNRSHEVKEGDTLWALADTYFEGLVRPAGFFHIIADFQPDPIFDPTIRLKLGRTLFIPSVRTLLEEIFSSARESEATP